MIRGFELGQVVLDAELVQVPHAGQYALGQGSIYVLEGVLTGTEGYKDHAQR